MEVPARNNSVNCDMLWLDYTSYRRERKESIEFKEVEGRKIQNKERERAHEGNEAKKKITMTH